MNELSLSKRSVVALVVLGLGVLVIAALCIALFVSRSGLDKRLTDAQSQTRQDGELIRILTAGLKSAQDLALELKLENSRLQLQISTLQKEIADLEKRIEDKEAQITELEKQIEELKTKVVDLEKRIEDKEAQITALEKQIEELKKKVADLEELLEKRRHEPFRNTVGIWMVPIIDGHFQMGSPPGELDRKADEVQHLVHLTKPFYLAVHEVTRQQYEEVMDDRPWEGKVDNDEADSDYPATFVDWHNAVDFCKEMTKLENIPGVRYHLPTEAQWEYACRAGTATPFWFGLAAPEFGGLFEWLGPGDDNPQPVGRKRENPWGLFDMHGNVDEWCQDWYGPLDNQEAVNPTGPGMGRERVVRGGTIFTLPGHARSARRHPSMDIDARASRGFRVARTYDAVPSGR
jgi:formylglycine-generating enzyme required for sulfatase activity